MSLMIRGALLCSLDTLVFSSAIGLFGSLAISKRKLAAAFAACDFIGTIAGSAVSGSLHHFPLRLAFPIAWIAYAVAIALVLGAKAQHQRSLYIIPLLLSIDNFLGAIGGHSLEAFSAIASAAASGMFSLLGFTLAEILRARIVHTDAGSRKSRVFQGIQDGVR